MTNIIKFQDKELKITDLNGTIWLAGTELSKALGYKNSDQVSKIYSHWKDEFTAEMSQTVKSTVSGNYQKTVRIYFPRGCHLIAKLGAQYNQSKQFMKGRRK